MAYRTDLAGAPLDIAPPFGEVRFRRFAGESDYPHIARLLTATSAADGGIRYETTERIANFYGNLYNCDPYLDMIFADVGDATVAYSRCFWEQELEGTRMYSAYGWVDPDYRLRGIGGAMLESNLARLREIASGHDQKLPKGLATMAAESDVGGKSLFEKHGFEPDWYLADMTRDLTTPIPELPLPDGIVVRTPTPDEYRKVFDADVEAFRDHHGATEPQESWYEEWIASPLFQPELWKVAWDGDEVISQVRNFVDADQNREYGRKRGWTEDISTLRPYRKQGIAGSLLCQSMQLLRDMGLEEAALQVHTDSPTGAFRLYEGVGFVIESQSIIWTKPLETTTG